MYGRILSPILLAILLTGCPAGVATNPQPSQSAPAGESAAFAGAATGDLGGRVQWAGDVPRVPPYRSPVNPLSEPAPRRNQPEWPNPCTPEIDPSGGVGRAVVFLRGVDPHKAKPWDLPPVRVEVPADDTTIQVCQGEAVGRVGFVKRGDKVDFTSRQTAFQSLHGRGAASFALPFPAPDRPQSRTLTNAGVVELSSGAGHFWMRGYLFVLDHPYVTQTDAQGNFKLSQVPPGTYELVVWHPNWQEASHARDADTCQICRLTLQPPLEVCQTVTISSGETRTVHVTLSMASRPSEPLR